MRIAMFHHSLVSDWNHGNAHFLRGVASELMARGHQVVTYAPRDGWSRTNLIREAGHEAIHRFHQQYPHLREQVYPPDAPELDCILDDTDLVIVHEWNTHALVHRIGQYRARNRHLRVLFHDTHHRSLTDRRNVASYDLRHYDGVLAFGSVIRDLYLAKGWAERAWVWHEAADTRVFRPLRPAAAPGQVVWVGNWGDEERTAELYEFLFDPVSREHLHTDLYGVRYPEHQIRRLQRRGIMYRGWLENYRVPEVFSHHAVTVHIPRRPYVAALPGIPTIRPFEALACGIPLICSPWEDRDALFTAGRDYLVARNGKEMQHHLRSLIHDRDMAEELAQHGRRTILRRHTCAHRVDELLAIHRELTPAGRDNAGIRRDMLGNTGPESP